MLYCHVLYYLYFGIVLLQLVVQFATVAWVLGIEIQPRTRPSKTRCTIRLSSLLNCIVGNTTKSSLKMSENANSTRVSCSSTFRRAAAISSSPSLFTWYRSRARLAWISVYRMKMHSSAKEEEHWKCIKKLGIGWFDGYCCYCLLEVSWSSEALHPASLRNLHGSSNSKCQIRGSLSFSMILCMYEWW